MGYELLNIFFFVFHSLIVLVNTLGWIFRATRRLGLITLLLTGASWFILGIWYGWGYCLCTDWHWQIRQKLGYHDESRNYIHLLILKLTGFDVPEKPLETGIMIVFLASVMLSVSLNLRDYLQKKRSKKYKK